MKIGINKCLDELHLYDLNDLLKIRMPTVAKVDVWLIQHAYITYCLQ